MAAYCIHVHYYAFAVLNPAGTSIESSDFEGIYATVFAMADEQARARFLIRRDCSTDFDSGVAACVESRRHEPVRAISPCGCAPTLSE
jgi:hypothetical protein